METMNKTIVVAVVVGILVVGVAGYILLTPSPTPNKNNQDTSSGGLPSDTPYTPYPSGSNQGTTGTTPDSGQGGDGTLTASVPSTVGGTIKIKDFTYSPETKKDPNNPGHYYLAGEDTTTAPYSIIYSNSDQSFVVSLLKEPIGSVRSDAEQKLMTILGINKAQACALRYWVGVPNYLNPVYAGKNLGFSFCPGATQL